MLSKNTETVNIVAAKISPFSARARRKEGARGRNSAAPERSPAARPPLAESRAEKLPLHFLFFARADFSFKRLGNFSARHSRR